jgi:hypothetical protein
MMEIVIGRIVEGFNPNASWDTYFCPRAHVKSPEKLHNQDNFLTLMKECWLWKPYERLKNELNKPDKWCQKRLKSATHSLHEVIPAWLLTKVLVLQDAPFWMNIFPS